MTVLNIPVARANVHVDDLVDATDSGAGAGSLFIMPGTIPASADTTSTESPLAVLTFSDPAFGAASSGIATASAITDDSSADSSGTATWYNHTDDSCNTVLHGDVDTSSATLVLNTTTIEAGGTVSVSSYTVSSTASL